MHTELVGALGQLAQHALAVSLLVVGLVLVGVLLALGQHRVDEPGELVRGSGHCLGLVHPDAHAAKVGPQRRLAGSQRRGRQPQGLLSTVGSALGRAAHHLAACDLRAWAQAQPAGEVLVAREPRHVSARPPAQRSAGLGGAAKRRRRSQLRGQHQQLLRRHPLQLVQLLRDSVDRAEEDGQDGLS